MIKINIVIDLIAKFEETQFIRLEKEEAKIKKKRNALTVTKLVPAPKYIAYVGLCMIKCNNFLNSTHIFPY